MGDVVAVGPGDSPVAVGDRVALPRLGHACGRCRSCVGRWETYCLTPQYMGYTMDGGYADFTLAYASHVLKIPEGVSWLDVAPITCAGVTTYKALKAAKPQPNETAMIVGIGRLGRMALQYAQIFGTETWLSTSRTPSCNSPRT